MMIKCPSCDSDIDVRAAPIRNNANNGSEAWVCLRCPAIICVDCYHLHGKKKHPEMTQEIKKSKKK